MKRNFKIKAGLLGVVIALIAACQPEKSEVNNGLTDPNVDASFTVTPIEGKVNTYLLKSNTKGVLSVKWDKGDGSGFANGKLIDTAYFPDAGTYNIKSSATGRGGAVGVSSKNLTVSTTDPNGGNLVQASKMLPADDAAWRRIAIAPGVSFALQNGYMVATGGSWGHAGIYTEVDVVAGKRYKVDMQVKGSGATDTWFELYVGMAAPQQNAEYTNGGKRLALNTWDGCGKNAFNAKLSSLSCGNSPIGGTVQFAQSGKAYIVVRTGGANLGTEGIGFTNVEFRGIQ